MARPLRAPSTLRETTRTGGRARNLERRYIETIVAKDWVYVDDPADSRLTSLLTGDSPPFDPGGATWANVPGLDGLAVPARFRLSPDLNLEIEGSFGGGVSGTVAWTLPVAWRRDYRKVHVASDDDHNIMVVTVDASTGDVIPYEALTVGAAGPTGAQGNTFLDGAGAPSSGLGADGDHYLNTSNGAVYVKAGGSWSVVGNITGPAGAAGANGTNGTNGTNGATWRDGTGTPSSGLGVNGDYYLDDATGNVYLKSGGSYSIVANIKGATGATGAAGPAGGAGNAATYGTSFPGSPANGDQHILVDSTTAPTYQWTFRYNASSSNTDKWEFIGGTPARVTVDTDESSASATYVDLATAGPSFTIPTAGEFLVEMIAEIYASAAADVLMALKLGAAATSDNESIGIRIPGLNQAENGARKFSRLTCTASEVLKLQYRVNAGAATGHWRKRSLEIIPVRCS